MNKPQASEYLNSPEKRALDIAVASSMGVLAMGGGALGESIILANNHWVRPVFKQERIGLGGKPFSIFKFRTWDYDGSKLKGADGLRHLGLDESPQFFNILLGQMSAVGYRPITTRDLNHSCQRLRVHFTEDSIYHPNNWLPLREQGKPGLTGATQTMPLRPDSGSLEHLVDVVEAESGYLKRATLLVDIRYLLKTPSTVFVGHNPTVAKSYLDAPEINQ